MNLLLLRQAAEKNPAPDAGVVWHTLAGMVESLLARSPYILIAPIVFVLFLLAGRVARGVVYAAGQRTRPDVTLADLLWRLTSFVLAVLGLFVAAVISDGDIERAGYFGARRGNESREGGRGGGARVRAVAADEKGGAG